MKFHKFALTLALASILTTTTSAQTQNIPVPASSVNGGRAVVAITMPTLPSNICTSDNNNCATMAGVQQGINGGSILIPNQSTGIRSWTSYFLGTTRCGVYPHPNWCATIDGNGNLVLLGLGINLGFAHGNTSLSWTEGTTPGCSSISSYRSVTAYPTGQDAFGKLPTNWVYAPVMNYYADMSGCSNN